MRVIVLIIFTFGLVWGQSLRERQGAYSLVEHLRGELRLGYIDSFSSAFGAEGHFHARTGRFRGWCLGGTLEGVARLDGEHPEFFPKSGLFATLSEIFVSYKGPRAALKAGRIMVEYTPHLDSDDIRLFPNYFRGLHFTMELSDALAHLLFVDRMAGWESGEPIDSFKNLGRVLGLDEDIAGVAVAGISGLGYEAWLYHIAEVGQILYLDHTFLGEHWSAGIQADLVQGRGVMELESRTIGLFGQWEMRNVRLYASANKEFGSGAAPSFGGGPLYTSMELLTLDLFGADAAAWTAGAEIDLWRTCFGAMYGRFWGEGSDDELDLYFHRRLGYGFGYDVLYGERKGGENIFRAIVRYGF